MKKLINELTIAYLSSESNMPIALTDKSDYILEWNDAFVQLVSAKNSLSGIKISEVLDMVYVSEPLKREEYILTNASFSSATKEGTGDLLHGVVLENESEKSIVFEKHMMLEDTIIQQISQVNVELSNLSRELTQKNRQIEQAYEQINKMISTDYLTEIFNRRYFFDRLSEMVSLNKRTGKDGFGVIMMDIDGFKHFNDTYGHNNGDRVLKEFTSVINKKTRKEDVFARVGGEEFCVLVHEKTKKKTTQVAEKLKAACVEISVAGIPEKIEASFGVAVYTPEDTNETLMKRADKALYKAKNTGKNKVVSI